MKKTMEDYIREITPTLLQNIEDRKKLTGELVEKLKSEDEGRNKTIVIVASGSSYNATAGAIPFMKSCMGDVFRLVTPFEFTYYEEPDENKVYLFTSQSGRSTNTIKAIEKYRKNGKNAIAIVGNRDSVMGKMAEVCIEYGVGEEKVGYVTKGMSTLCLFFMLLALELAESDISKAEYEEKLSRIKEVAGKHIMVVDKTVEFCKMHIKDLLSMDRIFCISGGANMATAEEGALKISEMVHVQTTVYEAEEFIHGPNLQITPNYTLFFVDGGDEGGKRIREIHNAAAKVTDKAYLISAEDFVENGDEKLTPLFLVGFFQYIAYFVSKALNITTEHPLLEEFEKVVSSKAGGYTEEAPF